LVALREGNRPLPEPGGLDAEGFLLLLDPVVAVALREAPTLLLKVVDQLVEQDARVVVVPVHIEAVVEENSVPVQVHGEYRALRSAVAHDVGDEPRLDELDARCGIRYGVPGRGVDPR